MGFEIWTRIEIGGEFTKLFFIFLFSFPKIATINTENEKMGEELAKYQSGIDFFLVKVDKGCGV